MCSCWTFPVRFVLEVCECGVLLRFYGHLVNFTLFGVQSKMSMEAISKVLDKCPEPLTSPSPLLTHFPDGGHSYIMPKLSKAGWARSHYSCMGD